MPKLSWTRLRWLAAVAFGFSLALAGAWVFWTANPVPGSHDASAVTVTSVNPGATTPGATRPPSGTGTAVTGPRGGRGAAADSHSGGNNADLSGSDPRVLPSDADPDHDSDDAASLSTSVFKSVAVDLRALPANQVPSFTKGADQRVASGGGATSVATWATAISQGRGETGQRVTFIVTNNNNVVFRVQPAISATGTLTYTPGNATGVARVSIRIHDNGGTSGGGFDTSAEQVFTITLTPPPPADLSGPTGGSVDAGGLVGTGTRYSTSTTLSINLSKGTDRSGVAPTGALLVRATATLTSAGGTANGTCGTFGDYSLVSGGTDPASPKADTVADQGCYRYQYVVADRLRNRTTYTSGDVKVDSTAPASPALTFSAFNSTYWGGGPTVFYRSAASTGSVTITGTGIDPGSGIAGFDFPALGASWTSTPGTLGVNTYSWASLPAMTSLTTSPAAPGTKNLSVTNNATGVSSAPFTLTADDTAPSGGTVTYSNGAVSGSTVSVSFTAGADGGSGIGAAVLQRASATLTGATCGSYGSFSTVTGGTNPTSPLVDAVTTGNCYRYQYLVSDNLGNASTATSANVVKVGSYASAVTSTAGLVGYWRLGETSGSTIVDSFGSNPGTYGITPTLGAAGAIAGDSNTAATFNGSNQYGTVARQIQDDFSIEFWFKSTQNVGSGCSQWYHGNGLVDAEVGGVTNDFGVALCPGTGAVVAGVGGSFDRSIVSAGGYNNGSWHHVVFTRTMATGALRLYIDGVSAGSATGSTASLTTPANIAFGRLQTDMQYFDGTLEEIAVYNTVLSQATVTNHHWLGTGLARPVLTATSSTLTYLENGTELIDPGITAADADSSNLTSATVTISSGYLNGQDTLTFTNQSGITGTWTAGTGVLALTGTATVASYQSALRSITYTNSSDNPSTAIRTVTFVASDGSTTSDTASRTITLTAVNDPPANSVPGAQSTTTAQAGLVFSSANGNQVTVSDPDAGSRPLQVQLVSTNGTMTLTSISGLTFSIGDGTADTTMTFTGRAATVNSRLSGMKFTPATAGPASLQIVTSDQGNTGTGGTLTDSDTIAITVTDLGLFTTITDIGSGAAGPTSSSYASGVYTEVGSGTDIYLASDQFHYLYRSWTGDGTIIARVTSLGNSDPNAKAAIMFRETTGAGSVHALMDIKANLYTEFLYRSPTGALTGGTGTVSPTALPQWLKLVRVGNTFTGSWAPDSGSGPGTWTQLDSQSITMPSTILVGLATTSHSVSSTTTATFDNVSLS